MGKRKLYRRKSSNSDTEHNSRKQSKRDNILDCSVSDVISEANNVLYASDSELEKMATSSQASGDMKELKEEMKQVLSAVKDIKIGQDSMRKSFDSKLDKMRTEFMTTLDGKIRILRDELAMDLSKETGRIDQLEKTLQSMQAILDTVERSRSTNDDGSQEGGQRRSRGSLNDTHVCITASGLPYQEGENLLEKAAGIIRALGDDVSSNVVITGAQRFRTRFEGRHGLVKISFENVDQKIKVLRKKQVLKDTDTYKRVILKSDRTYAERLSEMNTRTLLRLLPHGDNLRVYANGLIRERQPADQAQGTH